jgi:hypothetical protein
MTLRRLVQNWTFHNLFAHPASEVIFWMRHLYAPAERWSNWVHDATVPPHEAGTGRG